MASKDPVDELEDSLQLSDEDGVNDDVGSVSISNPAGRLGRLAEGADQRALRPGEATAMDDAEIMLRVGAGDDSSFDVLIEKYRRPVIAFMYRSVHNQAVAEELAQEVFLRIYKARASYKAEAKFSTWLYRIATNLAVNHARDTKSERSAPTMNLDQPDEESGSLPDVADTHPTVEQEILRRERLAAIRDIVMSLPERQRMAVLMHKYQNLDYKEIGRVLNLSESATKSLLFRAYEALRERLKEFV
ncbi:MAG: sigma-70 family RNA polymerase sigma factor [Acidobacteriaceae bacterium]